jgi:DNA-binding PadR family transcriptional regulator
MPQRIEVSAKPIEKPELVLPNPEQINMKEVNWILLTPENFEEKVAELSKNGRPIVFFALTDKGYENLSLNFNDIRSYIQQQKAIVAAYENYYKNANEALDAANSEIDGAKAQVDAQQQEKEEKDPFWKVW